MILLLGTYFYINMRHDKIDDSNDSVMVQSPLPRDETTPAEESSVSLDVPAETEQPEPTVETAAESRRYITDYHTVKEGESFSLVSGDYWNDIFLWPDLYVRNDMRSNDPDLIFPEEIIDIYNRLGQGDKYSEVETEELLKSYLQVYRVYKKLGPEKNNSIWGLLWCAAKYDHDFLDKYASLIDPEDLEMARKYVDEEGFLE